MDTTTEPTVEQPAHDPALPSPVSNVQTTQTPSDDQPPAELVPVDEPSAWRRLAAAVIEQAVWDYRSVVEQGGLTKMRQMQELLGMPRPSGRAANVVDAADAVHFFGTQAFENLCLFVRVDAESIREKLASEGSVT